MRFCLYRIVLSVLLLYSGAFYTFGQKNVYRRNSLEAKIGAGATMFFGDLGGSGGSRKDGFFDLDWQSMRLNASVGLKFNFTNKVALRSDFSYGRVSGSDAYSEDPGRFRRNLSFRSDVYELSVAPELVLVNFAQFGKKKRATSEIYVFGGVGVFRFNPKAEYEGQWYSLQPLGTEGQGLRPNTNKYALQSIVLPIGGGYRKNIGKKSYLGIELSLRKTFTDYIDDVSTTYYDNDIIRQERGDIAAALSDRREGEPAAMNSGRGNPQYNDNYSFVQIVYSRSIGSTNTQNSKIGKFLTQLWGREKCPSFQ